MGNGMSPIKKALLANHPQEVHKFLKEAGEEAPTLINDDFSSDYANCLCHRSIHNLFHIAIHHENSKVFVKMFLDFGADVNQPGVLQRSPLHRSAMRNDLAVVKLLLEHGADLHAKDSDGFLPVHCAAASLRARNTGDCSVLQYLLEEVGKPGDLEAKDYDGNTPLHIAARAGNSTTFYYLVMKGADVHTTNNFEKSPWDIGTRSIRNYMHELYNEFEGASVGSGESDPGDIVLNNME